MTSKRVVFTSPTKTTRFSPAKILDVAIVGRAVELRTEVRQGNGHYYVPDPDALEAILFGVVKKHKYLLAENYSSARHRHIPDEIKRNVWDRDGGRCVKCASTEYLEFDHDIPFSKGGASTMNNVRILCRRCNLEKSDRI